MAADDSITVRDWRRKPPQRLRVVKKLDIHWCWIKCTRCRHMRAVAIAPETRQILASAPAQERLAC